MSERQLLQRVSDDLERVADALTRIADADERRNDLLVEDAERREKAWQQELESRRSLVETLREEQ